MRRAKRSDADERSDLEWTIARARVVVAFATLIATILDPLDLGAVSRVVKPLLISYNAYALAVVLFCRFRREAAARLGPAVHSIDLFWAVAVTSVTGGSSSHFSPPLYVFALLASAFRWGLRETLVTGAVSITLLVAQSGASLFGVLGSPLRVGDFVMRSLWLALVAVVLGFLAERDKRLRAESDLLARISRRVSLEAGLDASVRAVVAELARALDAETAVLVMEDPSSGERMSWAVGSTAPGNAGGRTPESHDRLEAHAYLFPVPAEVSAWAAARPRTHEPQAEPSIHALDGAGRRIPAAFHIPSQFPGSAPWRSLTCLSVVAVERWVGRLLFINPRRSREDDQLLRFLQTAWQQVQPALLNIGLLGRLRLRLDELNAARLEAVTEKSRLQAVMDALPTGLAIIDANGGRISSNAAYDLIWGGHPPPVVSVADYAAYQAWWLESGELVQPEEWASALAVKHGETVTGQAMEIQRFDGEHAYVLNAAAPIFDPGGKVAGCAVVIQDISSRVEVERALAQSEAALKHSNELLLTANEALRRMNETLEARVAARTAELSRRTTQLRALAGDLTRAEERERQRVAQVIHDHLQQLLSVTRMKIGMARRGLGGAAAHPALGEADGLIAESLQITRSLTADLSPAILHRSGLATALRWLARWYADRYALEVVVEAGECPDLAEEVRVTLFRAVRELLFNVVKHAQVRSARVLLEHDGDAGVRIVVSDEGAGFDPAAVRAREGTAGSFGLFSVRERLEYLGGHLEVRSAPGRGTSIAVFGPVSGAQRTENI